MCPYFCPFPCSFLLPGAPTLLLLAFPICLKNCIKQSLLVGLLEAIFSVLLYRKKPLFPPYSWRIVSLDLDFKVESSFLSAPEKWCATSFWPPRFLMGSPLSCELELPPWINAFNCHSSVSALLCVTVWGCLDLRSLIVMSWHGCLWVYSIWYLFSFLNL